jgi:integrase
MKLDAKTITTIGLPGGKNDVIVFDGGLPGFGYRLRRAPGGKVRRSWVVQYRASGATRRLRLGAAEVLSPERARAAAKEALAKVALGQDPQAARAERRQADRLTMRAIVAEYVAAKAPQVRPRSLTAIGRYLADARYFGTLAGMPIDSVRRRDVAARLVVIAREHGPIAAARARGALSAYFAWAMRSGYLEINPVIGTEAPADKPRERVLSAPELAAVWGACKDDHFGRVVKLLTLTGCRRGEIGGMRWSELDFAAGTFTIPATRSKNGKAHRLPLVPMMLDIINALPKMATRDHIFGTRGPEGYTRWAVGKRELDKRSGVSGWTLHDIRRSVATGLADLGTPPHIIETILNHVSGHKRGVAGIYNRSRYEREVCVALALWSDHIRALIEGGERKIISLPQAAS